MSGIVVRAVRLEEWETFRAFRLRALQEDPAAFGARFDEELAHPAEWWRGRLEDPTRVTLVALDAHAWLGMAGAWTPPEGPPEAIGMWVAPEARGRGVGARLLEAAAAWARGRGADRLALWVNVAQLHAHALYVREGFAPTGPPLQGTRDPTRWFQRMERRL